MECIFVSDLHGNIKLFRTFFKIVEKEKPDSVFIGGDILPNQFSINKSIKEFLDKEFFSKIKKINKSSKRKIDFFVIMGNDDPKVFEEIFKKKDKQKIIKYAHFQTVKSQKLFVAGYSYVPPTPFQLKDWERYDVSRYVDVGSISPEKGIRTKKIDNDEIRFSTISKDLEKLTKDIPIKKTIFLFHSPPYKTNLDRAKLDGKKVDHAPFDVHVGSIAIRRFIEKEKPLLTLHGHVHESTSITGEWREKIGKTFCFSAAHDGPELCVIRFNTNDLENASRELISI